MKKSKRRQLQTIIGSILLGCTLLLQPGATKAQPSLPGCDANNYNILMNRAMIEGRRETAFNQAFIKKPDSVLEYTCFVDAMETVVADQIAPIFSETDNWVNRTVPLLTAQPGTATINFQLGPQSMNQALAATVVAHANGYIGSNFGHSYLGGAAGAGVGAGGGGPCGVMAAVWQEAKDTNFPQSGFYDFEELVGYDPRDNPADP